MFLIQSFTYWS